ncbi:amphi-Trp domain-containing protein [Truepera radiovictrix]|uniref:Amphi-Trp domain-containing protein n=1 Tax=Truepera radiovictrix (strain DSM 17093 / CIP 108686 / LMG 22925 / RQ-24) TaxID=649638 RepID=D7CXA8_TRURR|nr:amphi-Trp domain-containing protein [Truepera radiovictrix]ADI13232.1 conserved hypothetical protein [Truepera radiovictrix DSM 17093]
MGREVRRFKSEERKSRGEVSAFLRQLADKLDEGRITLRSGGEEVVLEPPQQLTLELQVEDEEKGARGVEHSLEVELAWFDGDEGGAVELS